MLASKSWLTASNFASTDKDKCLEMLTLLKDGNIKNNDSRSHCTSIMAASSAARTSSFINGLLNWVKNVLPRRYDVSRSSWVSNDMLIGLKV